MRDTKGHTMLDTVIRKYNNWKRYRSTYEELSSLSNRELNDLGIARSDIDRYARASIR
ncbi:uncharacterized protein YjiS (DUF1127 family) [Roseibium hamelinense]|uniref:Uncharacterized protein YjiS (DUF1127 family) n=1 Tax=Roseibium hamelinense TaxID=150831 RepID=A0A562THI2_9HYPH|nr:uncharacterized protein YjiS (DUF1127 family) [Roseibium hamelinense]